jgi:hypothetical protein
MIGRGIPGELWMMGREKGGGEEVMFFVSLVDGGQSLQPRVPRMHWGVVGL